MAKSNAEKQKLYRINLSKNKIKLQQTKEKSRIRDNQRRRNLTKESLEQFRIRQKQASKRYREKKKFNIQVVINPHHSQTDKRSEKLSNELFSHYQKIQINVLM